MVIVTCPSRELSKIGVGSWRSLDSSPHLAECMVFPCFGIVSPTPFGLGRLLAESMQDDEDFNDAFHLAIAEAQDSGLSMVDSYEIGQGFQSILDTQ